MASQVRRMERASVAYTLALAGLLVVSLPVSAQTPAADAPATPAPHKAVAPKHPRTGKLHSKPVPAPVVAETPVVAPPPPNWPVNAAAVPAAVSWDGRTLSISAANASLEQILHDISTSTGMKVDGLASIGGVQKDQRIFGSFGPAPARDVLGKLLEGSGLNVLMIGDKGEGTPRELVLTTKVGAKASPTGPQNGQSNPGGEEDVQEDPEPVDAPPPPDPNLRRPLGMQQPGMGRSPDDIRQEILQRQQQMQQQLQQQGQQPNQPQQSPNE